MPTRLTTCSDKLLSILCTHFHSYYYLFVFMSFFFHTLTHDVDTRLTNQ
jgi:hypothetical protein